METLIDRCREAKKAKNLSNQKVADLSGVNLSTVNNFFRAGQRSPSIDTVGPICAAVGVSMDEFFGVAKADTPPTPNAEIFRELIDVEKAGIKLRDRIIAALLIIVALLLVCLLKGG